MGKRKSNTDAIKLAASLMGKVGGKSRSEKKIAASKANIQKALASLTDAARRGTSEQRSAAQMTIPEEVRIARAKKAVSARWEKQRQADLPVLTNDRFRELAAGIPAREIAEGMKVSVAAVNSWRRQAKPGPLSAENGRKFLAWFEARPQQHGDRPDGKE